MSTYSNSYRRSGRPDGAPRRSGAVAPFRRRLPAFAMMLAATIAALLCFCADGRTIKVANMLYTTDEGTRMQVAALYAGFQAAFYTLNNEVGGNTIQFIEKDASDDGEDVVATLNTILTAHPDIFTIYGPFSDSRVISLLGSGVPQANELLLFSPNTGSQAVRFWSPNLMYTRADPTSELMVLMSFIINGLQVRRVGFMYLTGVNFGDSELKLVTSIISGMPEMQLFVYAMPYSDNFDQATFDAFADNDVQVIIVYGMPGVHVRSFMLAAYADPRTSHAIYLGSSGLTDVLTTTYKESVQAGSIAPRDGQIACSNTNLLPTDTIFNHIRVFLTEMENYLASGINPDFDTSSLSDPSHGEVFVSGWISGKVLVTALGNAMWNVDKASFMAGIMNQNRFVVEEDAVVGDFGGDCSRLAAAQGAVCRCNQGGRVTYLKLFDRDSVPYTYGAINFTYPTSQCYLSGKELPAPASVAYLDVMDRAELHSEFGILQVVREMVQRRADSRHRLNSLEVNTTSTAMVADTAALYNNHRVTFITGPIVPDDSYATMVKVDPLYPKPRTSAGTDDHTIIIIPTLEQQLFVAGTFLGDKTAPARIASTPSGNPISSTDFGIVAKNLSNKDTTTLFTAYDKTVTMYTLPGTAKQTLKDGTGIQTALKTTGTTFVAGMESDDAEEMAAFLEANPNAAVFLCYEDFSTYYTALTTAFASRPVSVRQRLLTATNMPHWADTSSETLYESPILQNFHDDMPGDAYATPRALQSYIAITLVDTVLTLDYNSSKLLDTLYTSSVWVLGGLTLGAYTRTCSDTDECTVTSNHGAVRIAVISMARALDPSVPPTYAEMIPSMVYTVPPKDKKLSTGAIVGIVVGCVVGVALIVVLIVVLVHCCSDSTRANRSAPKEATEPVTLVFTDIESSTALWAAVPQIMPDAVAAHHKLIRQVIKKYKCYEVKTIGDSFMIACKDPYAAVQLARDVQLKLLKYDWSSPEIESAYRSFEMRRRDEADDYQPPTAMLAPDVYKELWCGLRVRIGIHTGLSDIRYDERTKGYDYYGETSNMAARTEAIGNGGQVLLTESAYWALSHTERAELNCVSLGPQGLRGVPYAVEMYQLNAVPGRQHAALRTEIEAILPNDGMDDNTDTISGITGTEALLSSAGTMTGPAAAIAAVLTNCYGPYPPPTRAKELQPLLQRWNIPVPPRHRRVNDEDYCQGLINRLAIKMSTVAQMRMKISGANGPSNDMVSSDVLAAVFQRRGTGNARSTASGETALNAAALNNLPSRHCSIVPPANGKASGNASDGRKESMASGNPLMPQNHNGKTASLPNDLYDGDDVVAFRASSSMEKRISEDTASSNGSVSRNGSATTSRPPLAPRARLDKPSSGHNAVEGGYECEQVHQKKRQATGGEDGAKGAKEPAEYPSEGASKEAAVPISAEARRKSESLHVMDVTDDDVVSIHIKMPEHLRRAK